MSISQKLEKCYKNQIENIKNEKNYEFKIKQIGALVLDVGGRCISTISTAIGCCRAFVKKCYIKVRDKLEIKSNKNRCGRKKITEKYPELKNDIRKIIEEIIDNVNNGTLSEYYLKELAIKVIAWKMQMGLVK